MSVDKDVLYSQIGGKIRDRREELRPKVSQRVLAERLKLTRASIVNIEAGRQHAPIHVLWDLAEKLNTEISALLPTKEDLYSAGEPLHLSEEDVAKIEAATTDVTARNLISRFVSRASNPKTKL